MQDALYGERGFFTAGYGPAAHFRTSAQTATLAGALLTLLADVDAALGVPRRLDVVDIGAGRGELLRSLAAAAPPALAGRLRLTAVERAGRPADLPPGIGWGTAPPDRVVGLLLACEWLDNVPLDVVEYTDDGVNRLVLVDEQGVETLGPPVTGTDADWLRRWWPLARPGTRAEIGTTRDAAWSAALGYLERGLAVAVDYGHLVTERPPYGTLAAYRWGRQVPPVPDGSCDLTAHVAWDPIMPGGRLLTQRDALHRLGVTGGRPPVARADSDPGGYLRALAAASQAAELTDPAGLGAHHWLLYPVGIPLPKRVEGSRHER
jgi:SAM-dependent MidA family methyltransferase